MRLYIYGAKASPSLTEELSEQIRLAFPNEELKNYAAQHPLNTRLQQLIELDKSDAMIKMVKKRLELREATENAKRHVTNNPG